MFVRDHVRGFLHVPLNFGCVRAKNMKMIEEAGARDPQNIILSDESSLWGAYIYIAVKKELPEARMKKP